MHPSRRRLLHPRDPGARALSASLALGALLLLIWGIGGASCGKGEASALDGAGFPEEGLRLPPDVWLGSPWVESRAPRFYFTADAGSVALLEVEQQAVDLRLRLDLAGRSEPIFVDTVTPGNGKQGVESLLVRVEESGRQWLSLGSSEEDPAESGFRLRLRLFEEPDAALLARARARRGRIEGHALCIQGRRNAGLDPLRRALEDAEAGGDPREQAWIHLDLADCRPKRPDSSQVAEDYRRATALFREAGDPWGMAHALNLQGHLEHQEGRDAAAILSFSQSAAMAKASGDRDLEARAELMLARLERAAAEYEAALGHVRRAFRLARDHPEARGLLAKSLLNQAAILVDLQDLDEALAVLETATAAADIESCERLEVESSWVNVLLSQAPRWDEPRRRTRLAEAEAVAERLLREDCAASRPRYRGLAHGALATVLYAQGRAAESAAHLEIAAEALASADDLRLQAGISMHNLGAVYAALGRDGLAEERYEAAQDLLGETPSGAQPLVGRALLREGRGELEEALALLGEARRLVGRARGKLGEEWRRGFFAGWQRPYEIAMRIRVRQLAESSFGADPELVAHALGIMEETKARSLADTLPPRMPRGAEGGELSSPPPEGNGALLAIEELQRGVLDPDTVLLAYALSDPTSLLVLITDGSVEPHLLPTAADLATYAVQAEAACGRGGAIAADRCRRALDDLGRTLLRPISERVAGKTVLIVPDGALYAVPFAALPIPGQQEGSRLIDVSDVVVLPSIRVLDGLRRRRLGRGIAPQELLVVADPVTAPGDDRLPDPPAFCPPAPPGREGDPFERLDHARIEVVAAQRLVRPSALGLYAGLEATRSRMSSDSLLEYRALSFVTHGEAATGARDRPFLMLSRFDSKGCPVEGRWSLDEIYQRPLRADLVVLSACRSSIGKHLPGEGLESLASGFLQAGASAVVGSLWRVDSEATAALMVRFYEGYWGEGLTAATALRQAQLALRQENPQWLDPFFWAGFYVQGDWQVRAAKPFSSR